MTVHHQLTHSRLDGVFTNPLLEVARSLAPLPWSDHERNRHVGGFTSRAHELHKVNPEMAPVVVPVYAGWEHLRMGRRAYSSTGKASTRISLFSASYP